MKDEQLVSRVALLRERAGLTQLELSRLIGVTETTIANWEKGKSGRDWFERVARLCKVLNCTPEDLIKSVTEVQEQGVGNPKTSQAQKELLEKTVKLGPQEMR